MSTGRCLCGAVRFAATEVKTHFHACHCGMCRRWTGGPMFAAMADRVTFDGEENLVRFTSSDWAERGFCGRCGSHLFYYLKPDKQYSMCVGAFDDASQFTLTGEIYVDAKPTGYAFAGDLERLTEAQVLARYGPLDDNK